MTMRPILTYYGGKQTIAEQVVDLLPPHHHYIEPFCGGAAVFFAKGPLGGPSNYTETLNDTNANIISLYRAFQCPESRKALCERLEFTPHSKAEFDLARALYRSTDDNIPLQDRAWATLVLFCQSFSGIGRSWGWTKKNTGRISLRWRNRVRMVIDQLGGRLDWVQLDSRDALEVVQKYDHPGALFYCDPPYPGSDQGEYGGYSQTDFEALIAALIECKASVVLSCYDNPAVPPDWHKIEIQTRAKTITGRLPKGDKRTECVWIVDRSINPQLRLFGGA